MNNQNFYISHITPALKQRMTGKSYKSDCRLPWDELRYIHCLHVDLDGLTHEGEMVVNHHIADSVLNILRQLYEARYPIERMRLIDDYGADDDLSMEDNNSSAFNYRLIAHTDKISKHGLGLAVDINPLYNPYVKTVEGSLYVAPAGGKAYIDRQNSFPYKITGNDLCCQLFRSAGFQWGGDWIEKKDYQHFEIGTEQIAQWYPQFE
ncbi:MAG: M15 family metallopeptidase [Selenomonadaceae bacterium]|nr:M15 family metallopeptidase [Selenomonadaceae bacterium]